MSVPSPTADVEPLADSGRPGGGDARGPLPAGTELDGGRYRLGAPLGRGGFAITYAAVDVRLRRPVAIKELFPAAARRDGRSVVVGGVDAAAFAVARDRFLREATTLARFGHPSIVRVFAVFEERGTAYLVLERVEGRTLAAELAGRAGPLTEAEALDVAEQLAGALAVVHRAGVLHRDVSPSNLIRTGDGRIVLIDFGLARTYDDETMAMTRIVTPGYAPPEQHEGRARFSPRADVYAMGATLYRLLSGHVPPTSTRRGRGLGDLAPLWRVNSTVSRRVSDAVDAALSLHPDDRPASVDHLLERLGLDPTDARPGEATPSHEAAPSDVAPVVPIAPRRPAVDPGPVPAPFVPAAPVGPSDPPDGEGLTDLATAMEDDHGADDRSWRPSMVSARPVFRPEERPVDRPSIASTVPLPSVDAPVRRVVPAPLEPPPRAHPARAVVAPGSSVHHGGLGVVVAGGRPPGRGWVTWPLGLAAISLASCQPVGVTVLLGLGVAPVLGTVGDLSWRSGHPIRVAGWWLRNVLASAIRMIGPVVVLALGLGIWWITDAVDSVADASPWVLRITGGLCGWMVAAATARGSRRVRSDLGLDAVTRRLLPRGRMTTQALVLVIVAIAVAAAGLWFRPEAWPFGA